MANKILTPREFIKEKLGEEITWDNESDSCDYEWTIIEDLMFAYAQYFERAQAKTSNENGALPIPDVSGSLQCCTCGQNFEDEFSLTIHLNENKCKEQ